MTTTPQDHKPAVEPFEWTAPSGDKITLKPFSKLPAGVFRKAKSMNEMEASFALLEAAADEDSLAVIDELPIDELEGLFADWSKASEASLPQS